MLLLLPTSAVVEITKWKFDKNILSWSKAPELIKNAQSHVLWIMHLSLLYSKGSPQLSEAFPVKMLALKELNEKHGALYRGDSTACRGTLCFGHKWQGFGSGRGWLVWKEAMKSQVPTIAISETGGNTPLPAKISAHLRNTWCPDSDIFKEASSSSQGKAMLLETWG